MNTKITSVLLAALMVFSVMGAMAATEWQFDTTDQDNLPVLKGTENSTQSYNLTVVDATNSSGEGPNDPDIVLVAKRNASNIDGHSITTSGSGSVTILNDTWVRDNNENVWFRKVDVETDGNVTFNVTNGVVFSTQSEGNNTTLLTDSVRSPRLYAGALNDTSSVQPVSNASENVTSEIITHVYDPQETFSAALNDTTRNGTTIEIGTDGTSQTVTMDVTVDRDETDLNQSATTFDVVVDKNLATSEEVNFENLQNVEETGNVDLSHNGNNELTAYEFEILNDSQDASLSADMEVDNTTEGKTYEDATWVDIGYNAEVVGTTRSNAPKYDLKFVSPGGGFQGGTFLPVPDYLKQFGQLGTFIFALMGVVSVVGTGAVVWLLGRRQGWWATSTQEGLAYGSGTMLALFAIFSGDVIGWLLPVYTIIVVGLALVLWRQQEATAEVGDITYID